MNKPTILLLFALCVISQSHSQSKFIAKQGKISFFSYTSVENIEATNNQVLSIVDISENKLAVSMLMRAFVFKKALMEEHFNESYVESDIYPKATFEGTIKEMDNNLSNQTRIIEGVINIHGISKNISIKSKIENQQNAMIFSGSFNLVVADFKIKIPPVVAANIAKTIEVKFRFQYEPYE